MSEKYGFVYIWFDSFRKMYYIGCHWGTEDDGYICSSNRMRDAYRRRPHDFKRRIIKRIYTNKQDMFNEEYRILKMIPQCELGRKYYNVSKTHPQHWTINPNRYLSVAEKVSKANKGRKHNLSPEQRAERGRRISEAKLKRKEEKILQGLPIRKAETKPRKPRKPFSEESKAKRSASLKKAWAEGRHKGTIGKTFSLTPEQREKIKQGRKAYEASLSKSDKLKRSEKCSETLRRRWKSGEFVNRKSNNMKNYIWVTLSDGRHTRILRENFNPDTHIRGRI